MKILPLLFVNIFLFCSSCKYLNKTCSYSELKVETNTIGLQKIPLSESGINLYNSWLNDQHARWQLGCCKDSEYNEQKKWRDDNGKRAEKLYKNSDSRIYQEIKFAGKHYYLLLTGDDNIVILNKENKTPVKKLSIGKWTYGFLAREIMLKNKPYLVIVTHYPTWKTNTSVLFLLDTDFNIVYKEILTSADHQYGGDIGSINSDKYGNCIVVKTYNKWRRYEWDEWQKINGDFLIWKDQKDAVPK